MRDDIFHILNKHVISVINQKGDNLDKEIRIEIIEEGLFKVEKVKENALKVEDDVIVNRINVSLKKLLRHFDQENYWYTVDLRIADIYNQILDILGRK